MAAARTKKAPQSNGAAPAAPADVSAGNALYAGGAEPPGAAPGIQTVPEPIQRLTWLERISLFTEFALRPRAFLAQCTHPAAEAKWSTTQPKADHKVVPYSELRTFLDCLLPDDSTTRSSSNRRIQREFIKFQLGELPKDELQSAATNQINRMFPDSQPKGATTNLAEEGWASKKQQHIDYLREVLVDIENEIKRCLTEGQTHPSIYITSSLPSNKIFTLNSAENLFWESYPIRISSINYDDIPEQHPLRQLDRRFLPRWDRTDGPPIVLLGPAIHHVLASTARFYYFYSTTDAYCENGWKKWSERHEHYLHKNVEPTIQTELLKKPDGGYEMLRKVEQEEDENSKRYRLHRALRLLPWQTKWKYPEPPPVPGLDGFANRAWFAWDVLGGIGKYIARPPAGLSLADLLAARSILVSSVYDQNPESLERGVRNFVGQWYVYHRRTELVESMWSLARSSFEAVEALELELRDDLLQQYQKRKYLSSEEAQ
jgi:hypothetical protein